MSNVLCREADSMGNNCHEDTKNQFHHIEGYLDCWNHFHDANDLWVVYVPQLIQFKLKL